MYSHSYLTLRANLKNARLMICLLHNHFFCESAARFIFLAVLAVSRTQKQFFYLLVDRVWIPFLHTSKYFIIFNCIMKQSKHNAKPIALYLDREFVFLWDNCNRFCRFDLWFLFLILCTYKCKYQKGKNETHSSAPVFEAFFFSFLKLY